MKTINDLKTAIKNDPYLYNHIVIGGIPSQDDKPKTENTKNVKKPILRQK